MEEEGCISMLELDGRREVRAVHHALSVVVKLISTLDRHSPLG